MDTIQLRAIFSLHHTEPTVFFTDGYSAPFSIRYRRFLWWKWWELVNYRINRRGRMVKRVVARHTCPVNLCKIAEEEYTREAEEAIERNREEVRRGNL